MAGVANTVAIVLSLLLLFSSTMNGFYYSTIISRVLRGRARSSYLCSTSNHHIATLISNCPEGIASAASEIRRGGLVAFPTETVYGLGANIFNESSIYDIFKSKKRPLTDPLIVHIYSKEEIADIFDFSGDASCSDSNAKTVCDILADSFWPGPLTIIYKAKPNIPLCISAGTGFVGLRCPNHPIALALLKASALPIAAPSANRFGHVSPTSAQHVIDDLGDENIMVLKDDIDMTGGCRVGIESTVCRVSQCGDEISILRCGAVTSTDITHALEKRGVLKCKVAVNNNNNKRVATSNGNAEADNSEGAVAPGQMIKHYAPDVPTYILKVTEENIENRTLFRKLILGAGGSAGKGKHIDSNRAFVIDFGGRLLFLKDKSVHYIDLSPRGSVDEACGALFAVLREAESAGSKERGVTDVILVDLSTLAEGDERARGLWERLHRAASGEYIL